MENRLMFAVLVAAFCASFVPACNNNPNRDEPAQGPPEGVKDKAAYDGTIPAELQKEFAGATLVVQKDDQLYTVTGDYLGPAATTWCDSHAVCQSVEHASEKYGQKFGALEELKLFLAPGEVAVGNCAPVGGTMCAVPGNYTFNSTAYAGRISCNLVRIDGKAFMKAHAIPCEGGTECQMIGQYPVFGLCTKCETAGDCDDGNPCTNEVCNNLGQCILTNNAAACPDGNLCNGNETCVNGQCTAGSSLDCDDANPCTDDACLAATGCSHVNNSAVCSDNSLCTIGDVCVLGQCQSGGTSPNCDDGDVCTADSCTPAEGCKHAQVPDTVVCDDGNACTLESSCETGVCVASSSKSCSDANPCTTDSCDSTTGACSNQKVADGTGCPGDDANKCVSGTCVPDFMVCTEQDQFACSANLVQGQMVHAQCTFQAGATKGTWTVKTVCGPLTSLCFPATGCSGGTPTEVDCADSVDNDGDEQTDCADSDCTGTTACKLCANNAECDDGDACTNESCVGGFCQSAPVVCNGGVACNPATGCPQPCTPQCTGKECGNDGCGGSCGTCGAGSSCNASGQCVAGACTPNCLNQYGEQKECGSDGCGGSCGSCGNAETCSVAAMCVTNGLSAIEVTSLKALATKVVAWFFNSPNEGVTKDSPATYFAADGDLGGPNALKVNAYTGSPPNQKWFGCEYPKGGEKGLEDLEIRRNGAMVLCPMVKSPGACGGSGQGDLICQPADLGLDSVDTDGDGTLNGTDADDDNDGKADTADQCPWRAAATATGCP